MFDKHEIKYGQTGDVRREKENNYNLFNIIILRRE